VCVVRCLEFTREILKRETLYNYDRSLYDQHLPRRLSHRHDVVHVHTRSPFLHQHIDVQQHMYVAGVDLCLRQRRDKGEGTSRAKSV
jgi:hypothetical protein